MLKLGTLWSCRSFLAYAIEVLSSRFADEDPFHRLDIAFEYKIPQWVLPMYDRICRRPGAFTVKEGQKLGWERFIAICAIQRLMASGELVVPLGSYAYLEHFSTDEPILRRITPTDPEIPIPPLGTDRPVTRVSHTPPKPQIPTPEPKTQGNGSTLPEQAKETRPPAPSLSASAPTKCDDDPKDFSSDRHILNTTRPVTSEVKPPPSGSTRPSARSPANDLPQTPGHGLYQHMIRNLLHGNQGQGQW